MVLFLYKMLAKKVIGAGQDAVESRQTGENFVDLHQRHKLEQKLEKTEKDLRKAKHERKNSDIRSAEFKIEELQRELAQYQPAPAGHQDLEAPSSYQQPAVVGHQAPAPTTHGATKFCTSCGVKNAREAKFCGECGHHF